MYTSSVVDRLCDRFSLSAEAHPETLSVQRHQWRLDLDAKAFGALSPGAQAWVLVGARLGFDFHLKASDNGGERGARHDQPMRFRRARIRRYHEAPSVHGDHLPLLLPRIARRTFESITDAATFSRPWLIDGLDILVINQAGMRIDVLTEEEQNQSDLDAESRWDKVRSALFYQSYKVRPQNVDKLKAGRLRHFHTEEGVGGTRALLLPDFDYDASRDHGYLALPTYDDIIIARPEQRSSATSLLEPLEALLQSLVDGALLPMGDAIIQLTPKDLGIHRPLSDDFRWFRAPVDKLIVDLSPP